MTSLSYDYSVQVDKPMITEVQKQFATAYNVTSTGENKIIQSHLNEKSYPGFTADDNIKVTEALGKLQKLHDTQTQAGIVINSLTNMNTFVEKVQIGEADRMQDLNSKSMSNLYKMKQEYMNVTNAIHHNQYNITIIKSTLLACIALFLVGIQTKMESPLLNDKYSIIAVIVIGVIYILILIILYRNWLKRRNDDYTKLYFQAPKKNE